MDHLISGVIGATIVFGLYFLPAIIAFSKEKKNKIAIFVTNLLLGWTILGWIFCLVWSLMND